MQGGVAAREADKNRSELIAGSIAWGFLVVRGLPDLVLRIAAIPSGL